MATVRQRGLDRAERAGLTRQLEVLKEIIGPAARGWEIDYQPGEGWGVIDPAAAAPPMSNIPVRPLGMKRWPVLELREALTVATVAAHLTRRTFER